MDNETEIDRNCRKGLRSHTDPLDLHGRWAGFKGMDQIRYPNIGMALTISDSSSFSRVLFLINFRARTRCILTNSSGGAELTSTFSKDGSC